MKASRAQILKKAYETIQMENKEVNELDQEIKKIENLNRELRKQLEMQRTMNALTTGTTSSMGPSIQGSSIQFGLQQNQCSQNQQQK